MAAAAAAARSQRREGREGEAEKARAVWAGGTRKNAREARASILKRLRENEGTNGLTGRVAFISRAIARSKRACHARLGPWAYFTVACDGFIPLVCVDFFKAHEWTAQSCGCGYREHRPFVPVSHDHTVTRASAAQQKIVARVQPLLPRGQLALPLPPGIA
jgi:hypothetical protein